MNGGNLGNEVIDAMFPVQQLILYEADGQRVYRNYVGVSFPKGTNKLPIPLDAGVSYNAVVFGVSLHCIVIKCERIKFG